MADDNILEFPTAPVGQNQHGFIDCKCGEAFELVGTHGPHGTIITGVLCVICDVQYNVVQGSIDLQNPIR